MTTFHDALRDTFHEIWWIDFEREPQCKPNPDYPDGIDILSPRPAAKRIGSLASSSWSRQTDIQYS